jgi:hypothetical protein
MKNLGLNFNELVLDYEMATRKAIQLIYPSCKISHCHFHYAKVKYLMLNVPDV